MKIKNLEKLDYFETYGGPICICNANNKLWNGSYKDNSDYWLAISSLRKKTDTIVKSEIKNELYFLLNSENSGFFLFKNSQSNLIILEIFYIETDDVLWNDIEFTVTDKLNYDINLSNGCLVYDSSFSIKDLPIELGFHKLNSEFYNYYNSINSYKKCKHILIKNNTMHLEGVILI